jgi:hypothetical protein
MSNTDSIEGGGVMANDKTLAELIAAADGSIYQSVIDNTGREAERFTNAVNDKTSEVECRAAWHAYSKLAARAFRFGRLWTPEIVWLLAPVLIVVNAEIDELERIEAACNAMPEVDDDAASDAQVAQIKSPCGGLPTLRVCDGLALGLDVPREECRIRAGYLTEEAQPGPIADKGVGQARGGSK